MIKSLTRCVILSTYAWMALASAAPTSYPDGPIHLVVPFAAGGGVDNVARIIAPALGKQLGTNVIVENRPGANANIGASWVARAKPDGTTLLVGATFLAFNRATMKDLPYDSTTAFTPIGRVGTSPFVLIVPAKSNIHDVAELVAQMKSSPNKASYGAVAAGSPSDLMFAKETKTRPVQVLYKGGSAAYPDLISGRLTFMIQPAGEVLPLVLSGQLRALAVSGPVRMTKLPNVPTMRESGVHQMQWIDWWGVFAPAKQPAQITQKQSEALEAVLKNPSVIDALNRLGIDAAPASAPVFNTFYKKELTNYQDAAKQFNLAIN